MAKKKNTMRKLRPSIPRAPSRSQLLVDDYYYRVKNADSATRLWEQVLTQREKDELGGNFSKAFHAGRGTIGMWTRLRGCTETRAIIELARILGFCDETTRTWLLRETKELSDDPEEALELALGKADLVLTESPRSAYWMGERIDINWQGSSALWDYFMTLCEAAKAGRHIDAKDFGEHVSPDNHIKLKSRLTRQGGFPAGLEARLTALGGGRQKLDLPPDRICILRLEVREVVREFQG